MPLRAYTSKKPTKKESLPVSEGCGRSRPAETSYYSIDVIMYKLYGLTPEEIALIEGFV